MFHVKMVNVGGRRSTCLTRADDVVDDVVEHAQVLTAAVPPSASNDSALKVVGTD